MDLGTVFREVMGGTNTPLSISVAGRALDNAIQVA